MKLNDASVLVPEFGVHSRQGCYHENEDRIAIHPSLCEEVSFFAVYDGHGGCFTVDFLLEHLHENVCKHIGEKKFSEVTTDEIATSITEAFAITDSTVIQASRATRDYSGSCACFVLHIANTLCVTNLGDSRAVAAKISGNSTKVDTIVLSTEHKPRNEKKRLTQNGGWVSKDGRVNGVLSCSRAFGDRELKFRTDAMNFDPSSLTQKSPKKSWKKGNSTPRSTDNSTENSPQDKPELLQLVLSEPDVQFYNIVSEKSEILFYVIASDGFWDYYSSKKCVQLVLTLIAEENSLTEIAEKLCEKAFRAGSKDDISIIVVVPKKERLFSLISKKITRGRSR